MMTIIISNASERFVYVQKEHKKGTGNKCREKKIHQRRLKRRSLNEQYKRANDVAPYLM